MKRSILLGLLVLPVLAGDAFAQSTGSINVVGSVQKAAAIRWWSYSPLVGEVGSNNPATQNGVLDFSLDVDDVAAGNNLQDYTGGTVQVILRSNTAYTLTAQVAISSGFGIVANGDAALADVGFGVSNLVNSGGKVFGDPASASTITAGFEDDPSLAVKDVDEEPTFSSTLDDLTAGVTVLSGPRISNRGGVGSPNNGLLVDSTFAIAPQFYTPTDPITAQVTYTLATP